MFSSIDLQKYILNANANLLKIQIVQIFYTRISKFELNLPLFMYNILLNYLRFITLEKTLILFCYILYL